MVIPIHYEKGVGAKGPLWAPTYGYPIYLDGVTAMDESGRILISFPGRSVGSLLEHLLHYPVLEKVESSEFSLLIKAIHPGVTHEFAFVGEHNRDHELAKELLNHYLLAIEEEKAQDKEVNPYLMVETLRRAMLRRRYTPSMPEPRGETFIWLVRSYCDLLERIDGGSQLSYYTQLERVWRYYNKNYAE